MTVRLLTGDCRELLASLEAGSVHCCVTSPPYFGLRDYGVDGQMGLEPTPDEFVAGMVAVFREVRRVLRDDGVLFLNIGDSYASQGGQRTYGSYDGATGRGSAPARRVAACGTGGKAPEDSPARDCLCRSLCGACREAYRIGKSHSARPPDPTPLSSSSSSIPAHTGSPSGRPAMSDSTPQVGHNAAATPDPALAAGPAVEPPHDALASTMPQSSLQPPASCSQTESPAGGCQLCGRSLQRFALASAHMVGCICDSAPPSLAGRNRGRDASGLAYPSSTTESLKPKDLIGIPWLLAFALRADGWYLRQDIIWSKPNPMPESVRDRCTKAHEYLFLLSKSPRYYFDADAIAEPIAAASIARLAQNVEAQTGSDRVPGKTNGPMKAVGKGNARTFRGGGAYTQGRSFNNGAAVERESHGNVPNETGTRNRRSVWEVTTQPFSEAHFATFPPALIEPCILAGCPEGGTVLDPFGGAGTTGLVADRLRRNAVLIELNPAYASIAERRLHADAGMFADLSCDSGSDRNGGDALAAPCEASQSGLSDSEGIAQPIGKAAIPTPHGSPTEGAMR